MGWNGKCGKWNFHNLASMIRISLKLESSGTLVSQHQLIQFVELTSYVQTIFPIS